MKKSTVYCYKCGEKFKDYRSKVVYDPKLSDPKKGRKVYFCINHEPRLYFVIEEFEVNDDISSARIYCLYNKTPDKKPK